jgi:proteasome accessory factor A
MDTAMFGVESEYAIAGVKGKDALRHDDMVNRLVQAARRRLLHLQDAGSPCGIFLENGARFYIDCGLHPEMTMPECTTPWELARYIKAGERTLESLAREVQTEYGAAAEIMCFRCNVDYSGSGSTWGCHESYLHRAHPSSLPDQLIPHLVTRVIYTGAGGFNPVVNWPEFCVAPRLMHIQQVVSGDSTGNRGIFHTKNESLCGNGYNRLHILCGESLCSQTAIMLKIGVTALIVALAEAGLRPANNVSLSAPLDALHVVSADIACKRPLGLLAGGQATALEIQRHLLARAERNLALLPPWAGEICALWRQTLDRLEGAPDGVATLLDWAIKLRLFQDRARRHGIPFERFPFLNSMVRRLSAALAATPGRGKDIRISLLPGPESPIPEEAARIRLVLAQSGLAWSDLEKFLKVRDEFYQIDTRFGQLGPRGIFEELDRCGAVDHRVAGIDGVDEAMRNPPAVGRAAIRGEVIRRMSGQMKAGCEWQGIVGEDGRSLDLSDPFADQEVWTDPHAPPPGDPVGPAPGIPGDEFFGGDYGRWQQMVETMRRRYGRSRTRAQGSPETTEGTNR